MRLFKSHFGRFLFLRWSVTRRFFTIDVAIQSIIQNSRLGDVGFGFGKGFSAEGPDDVEEWDDLQTRLSELRSKLQNKKDVLPDRAQKVQQGYYS